MRRLWLPLVLLAVLARAAAAAGTVDYVGRFSVAPAECDLAIYAEGNDKVGLVGIDNGQRERASVAFSPNEWHFFVELWDRARGMQTSTWQLVGSFAETGTSGQAVLTVLAGRGVQINVSGKTGFFSFELPPDQLDAFDAKVREMANRLH